MTPSGIELATFRLVAQCLIKLRHRLLLLLLFLLLLLLLLFIYSVSYLTHISFLISWRSFIIGQAGRTFSRRIVDNWRGFAPKNVCSVGFNFCSVDKKQFSVCNAVSTRCSFYLICVTLKSVNLNKQVCIDRRLSDRNTLHPPTPTLPQRRPSSFLSLRPSATSTNDMSYCKKLLVVTVNRFYPPRITLCLWIFVCKLFILACTVIKQWHKVAVVCEVLKDSESGLDVLETSIASPISLLRFG